MKTNLLKLSVIGCAFATLLITSCSQETDQAPENAQFDLAKIKAHAITVGYNPDDIEIKRFYTPDGAYEMKIFIEEDQALSVEEFFALENINTHPQFDLSKHYRTNNLVSSANRTIDIVGYTANDQFKLSAKAQAGLQNAVNNYNALSNTTLRFRLTYGSDLTNADMVVYDTSFANTNSGGVAGFPSNGRAFTNVQIYNLEGFSTDVNEHVITHEIGHSVGFRHSDYFSRQSCGQTGEAAGPDGAVYISGTPRGFDATSIMNACFAGTTNGEFNNNDKIALDRMY